MPFISVPSTYHSLFLKRPSPSPTCQNHTHFLTTKQNALLTFKSRVTVPAKSDFPFSALLQHSVYTAHVLPGALGFIRLMDQTSASSVQGMVMYTSPPCL